MNPDFLQMILGGLGMGGQGGGTPVPGGAPQGGAMPQLPQIATPMAGMPGVNPLQSILQMMFQKGFGGPPPAPQAQPVAAAGPAGTPDGTPAPIMPVRDPNQPTPQQMGTATQSQKPFRFGQGGWSGMKKPGGFGGVFSGGSGF